MTCHLGQSGTSSHTQTTPSPSQVPPPTQDFVAGGGCVKGELLGASIQAASLDLGGLAGAVAVHSTM